MQEHPQIELYISVGDEQQNASVEQLLASVDLDGVVTHTLQAVRVTQPVMLTLLLTDDNGIKEMNQQYRQQNKATDVLSFPLIEQPLVDAPVEQLWPPQEQAEGTPPFVTPQGAVLNLGDIIMSWPTLVQQATSAGHSPVYELLYLLSHGILHLVGYDDQTETGYQAMVQLQHTILQAVGQKG